MSNIPKRNLASGCHLFKKIDQPSWRTTRLNCKQLPQIVCISSRFRVLHPLSWELEQSEILWRYTVILVCRLKHVEVGWSTQNYPLTSHLSDTCTLSRWHDAVFLYEVSISRSKGDEKWIFLIDVITFPLSEVKTIKRKKKEENFDWMGIQSTRRRSNSPTYKIE